MYFTLFFFLLHKRRDVMYPKAEQERERHICMFKFALESRDIIKSITQQRIKLGDNHHIVP